MNGIYKTLRKFFGKKHTLETKVYEPAEWVLRSIDAPGNLKPGPKMKYVSHFDWKEAAFVPDLMAKGRNYALNFKGSQLGDALRNQPISFPLPHGKGTVTYHNGEINVKMKHVDGSAKALLESVKPQYGLDSYISQFNFATGKFERTKSRRTIKPLTPGAAA